MPRSSRQPTAMPLVPLPATLEPQLATLVDKPRPGNWLYEIKFDGYRMLARIEGKSVRIITRRGNDWTTRFPRLVKELKAAKLPDGWYDGEIVMLGADGQPDFNALQNAIEGGRNDAIVYYLFDCPFLAGQDLRSRAVEERRAMLQQALSETADIRFSQEIEAPAKHLLAKACELGLEGVIGKRRGSPYVHRRSDDWIKLKCTQRQEFVIGGYTWPDSGAGIGALLVGQWDDAGTFQYAGKVGTGFTGEISAELRRKLDAIAVRKRPFAGPTGHDRRATWVRPELVCEVAFSEWPEKGSLRHASFKGLRADKEPATVQRERSEPASPPRHPLVTVTHGDRVIDPSTGITKLELLAYYAAAARWALPHLRSRHIFIRRAPAGIHKPMVFQEHPEGLRGLKGTDPKLWPGHEPAISIESAEDLVEAAQVGMVELHTWNSTAAAIQFPDRMMLDLDPGEGVAWAQMQEAATLVRAFLEDLGLRSWLKTSGGKGLHIAVPLKPERDHQQVKAVARAIAQHLARTIPQRFSAKSGAANRLRRVFVDYLRNGPAQTTAAAFSARARPGMGVSVTVSWEELPSLRGGDEWTVRTAAEFLRGRKDPWAGYWRTRQTLDQAAELLALA